MVRLELGRVAGWDVCACLCFTVDALPEQQSSQSRGLATEGRRGRVMRQGEVLSGGGGLMKGAGEDGASDLKQQGGH
jgi:hypothetical protein